MSAPAFRIGIAIAAGLFVWAAGYWFFPALKSDTALGQQTIPAYAPAANTETSQRINGQALYINACQSCHQPSGQGLGKVFPPLDGADWVTGDAQRLALIVLQGMTGTLSVKGQTYNSFMPGFKAQFSDEELAALLSYIRSAWGNTAAAVSSDTIRQARTSVSHMGEPWRGEQALLNALQSLPATQTDRQEPAP